MEGVIALAVLLFLALPVISIIYTAIAHRRLRDKIELLERRIGALTEGRTTPASRPAPATAAAPQPDPIEWEPIPPAPIPAPPATIVPGGSLPVQAGADGSPLTAGGAPIFRTASPDQTGHRQHRTPFAAGDQGLEQVIGTRWMVWAGVSILVLGIGFFLKYAFEHGWIGPTARVVMGILAGLALLIAGEGARRRQYRFLSQGMTGGGIGALYLSIYAASGFYHLLETGPAFLLMGLVTATGIALAVLHDGLPIAILATLGGLITPVLLSTGEDRAEGLFAYLGVLDLGVLGAAFYRRWRALDLLASAGTILLYGAWFASYYQPDRMEVALFGLVGFFLLFILIPIVPVIRSRDAAAPEAALLPLGAGFATYFYAYRMLHESHRTGFALMLLLMAACHLLLALLVKRCAGGEQRLIGAQLGMSMSLLTLAIPARLGLQAITVAWAVEGPLLLWLGYRYGEPLVRAGGCLVLTLALSRVFLVHQPLHRELFRPLMNRAFGTVFVVVAAFGAGSRICSKDRASEWSRTLASALALVGGMLLVVLLTMETVAYGHFAGEALQLKEHYQILTWVLLESLWAISGLIFLSAGMVKADVPARNAGLGWLLLAGATACLSRYGAMNAADALVLNRLYLTGVLVALCLWNGARLLGSRPAPEDGGRLPMFLFAAALVEIWWVSTVEAYRYFASAGGQVQATGVSQWRAQLAVTVTWALIAVALLAAGFLRRQSALRYAAFALLGLAGVKVVLVDMSQARQIYRVISLVGLGLVMMGVSYVYSRVLRSRGGRPV